jgi:hypothetical protein
MLTCKYGPVLNLDLPDCYGRRRSVFPSAYSGTETRKSLVPEIQFALVSVFHDVGGMGG